MIAIIILLIAAQRAGDIRENKIKDNCVFEKIRISISDVTCDDLGFHKKYCNHVSLPKEFVISKELSYDGNHYEILPKAMYDSSNDKKVANFYYYFSCDKENGPELELNIIPRPEYDKEPMQEIFEFLIVLFFILFIVAVCPCVCKDGFLLGFILGSSVEKKRGYYCE